MKKSNVYKLQKMIDGMRHDPAKLKKILDYAVSLHVSYMQKAESKEEGEFIGNTCKKCNNPLGKCSC